MSRRCAPRHTCPEGRWCSSTRRHGSSERALRRRLRRRPTPPTCERRQRVRRAGDPSCSRRRPVRSSAPAVVDPVDPAEERGMLGLDGDRSLDPERLVVRIELGDVRAQPTGGQCPRSRSSWAWSRKPSLSHASRAGASTPPVSGRDGSSFHQLASAVCTAAPSELCAHGGPLGGGGRSR